MTPRIAYLLKKFPRLSETFVLNEVLALENQGLAPLVFSRRAPDDEVRHPQFADLDVVPEVLPPPREIDPWQVLFFDGPRDLVPAVQQAVTEFRAFEHPRLASLLVEAIHLRQRCAELDVGHVHAHFGTDAALAAALLRALGGPGYSLTLHAKDIYRDTVDPALLSRLVAGSRFSITVCDANVRHLEATLSAEACGKLRRLYNGIDLSCFSAGREVPRDEGHVLAVARLVEKKGLDVLVDAAALLRQRGVPCRVTIVGDGEERQALEQRVEALGLGDHVTLTGPLPQDQVARLMRQAMVFCLPCVVGADGNRDALPTVLLEALAIGLPCISTPVSGIPEILDHGNAGVLVPERDVESTAHALEGLLADGTRRRKLAAAGRALAAACFDREQTAATLGDWFRQATAEAGAATCASSA